MTPFLNWMYVNHKKKLLLKHIIVKLAVLL